MSAWRWGAVVGRSKALGGRHCKRWSIIRTEIFTHVKALQLRAVCVKSGVVEVCELLRDGGDVCHGCTGGEEKSETVAEENEQNQRSRDR